MTMTSPKPILIREVWAHNLHSEFELLRVLVPLYPYISMDTEFPGFVFQPPAVDPSHEPDPYYVRKLKPSDQYAVMKSNVDALNVIQVGLTLADADGNLPDLGTDRRFIWQFNFRDFDITRDVYAPNSIDMLRRQGIDFELNRIHGVDSAEFAQLMKRHRLVCNKGVTWVTFHSAYDLGYLVKMITGNHRLPDKLNVFLRVVRLIFGERVYDIKHMMRFCNSLFGGLDCVARTLRVERVVGRRHQAGSDSLLIWQVFKKMMDFYFDDAAEKHAGVLYGLECSE
ncbi:Ribonuclease [Parasponia andersonii]|uniref:poly(A)-specific ribonuclease n=1 Tax=Parasponia andersonii TaxID=3476 RepID=A0A2P5CWK9_PARAD|nr:Ribonuclease [Parasponia andersonii]